MSRPQLIRRFGYLAALGVLCFALLPLGCGSEEGSPGGPDIIGPTGPTGPTGPDTPIDEPEPQPDPVTGETDFVSAGEQAGSHSQDNAYGGAEEDAQAAPTSDDSRDEERTVEEGDIYRVLGNQLILNLNSYRGLQIIDFSDLENPEIIGRVAISGYPVELYVVGQRAFVLMNNWTGYWGSRDDVEVETYYGGVVAVADISDPTNPIITDHERVPGWIRTSRLTRGGGHEALFVVSNDWSNSVTTTSVRSFTVSAAGKLDPRSSIDLGGYVTDIQGFPAYLTVATYDWNWETQKSRVAVIDISDPLGTMVLGAEVEVAGYVRNKTNMDVYNGILRVASDNRWWGWGDDNANHLQTFDISDIHNPVTVDHATFAEGEDLYATLFLGNKAFFVTYRNVDPFHAFAIDDEGHCTEMSQFVISGWNDFFKPVFDETRLIGIGMNDEAGRTMAVSLYDITDLTNPDPFIGRAEVEADYSWSEAQWDDRAFSVLENAVEVEADDGTVETGLVLLPFTGYDYTWNDYTAAVQIFTFSESTLTRRGVMEHGTPVRRSFLAQDDVSANLSEVELSLFDHSVPDDPEELGRVELAPNYSDFLLFGDYGVRLKNNSGYWSWWYWDQGEGLPNTAEIIPLDQHPDTAQPAASIELPMSAFIQKVGDLLVAISTIWVDGDTEGYYLTTIEVYDLTDPTHPVPRGTLTTDQIEPSYYYGGYYYEDCWDCGMRYYGYYYNPSVNVVGEALVFAKYIWENELLGTEEWCNRYPDNSDSCYYYGYYEDEGSDGSTEPEDCVYYYGGIYCSSLNGAPEVCSGAIYRCVYDDSGNTTCEEVDPDSIETYEYCYTYDRYDYWTHFGFDVVDLTDPDHPGLTDEIVMPREERAAGLVVDGSDLFVNYDIPAAVEGDSRPYLRYYIKVLDLTQPSDPQFGPGINVPGILLAVDGDTIFTKDMVWGETVVESAINKLLIRDDLAFLQARRRFPDQEVYNILLDGRGHVLVSHRTAWQIAYAEPDFNYEEWLQKLTILDAESDEFAVLSEFEVDVWASLMAAHLGRALFTVSGGILVINVADPENPFAQAYFPVLGWPNRLVPHDTVIDFAAGRYGMYRFNLDEFNLLTD